MKNLYLKDRNRRCFYLKTEKNKIILKYYLNNLKINKNLRENAYSELINWNNNTSITKIHNRCIITNRSRGVYKKFKLSRIFFKKYALEGNLNGIRKASW
jgi:ribosomal protein S14